MVKILSSAAVAGLMALAVTATAASATPIAVNNFSFEGPNLGGASGAYDFNTCPTSWTCSPAAGPTGFQGGVYVPTNTQFSPSSNGFPANHYTPDGVQAAYIVGTVPQGLEQDTGLIAANTTYTLGAWAGARADQTDPWTLGFTPTLEILANGTVVKSLLLSNPGSGLWGSYTVSWDSSLIPADVGATLGIELLVGGSGTISSSQVAWDDVTLNAVADAVTAPSGRVPEPITLSIFGAGLAGAAALRRRRRKA